MDLSIHYTAILLTSFVSYLGHYRIFEQAMHYKVNELNNTCVRRIHYFRLKQ